MGEEAASPDPHIPATPFESEGPTRPTPAAHEAWHDRAVGAAGLPASIGGYRVVSLLGQGGMGAVYLAEQEKPHRRVALKLMRAGASSERALRRFEHEAELLGRLVHPGIAQIYEAGLAEGVPFFAMELVEGRTLLAYCDETKMGTRERLALFARICDAVHHAHTKGVIHRDLKPGNILVTEVGTPPEPQPKILDFGVARATDADIGSTTMRTDVGQILGTLPYMSPEQVGGENEDLDTRSDVYSLGVVLYELLVGKMPYDLERRMIHEAARIIREDDPTRLSSVDARLRGDVETIVAKAMEKSRERRYQTALDLGSEVRRYLADEPIAARPASAAYQFRKFTRRNRALVAGVAATLLALVVGLAGTTYGLIEADIERDRADERAEAATAAEAVADARRAEAVVALGRAEKAEEEERTRADELQKVSEFQAQMLAQVDPTEAGELLTADVTAKFEAALVKSGVPESEVTARAIAFREQWAQVNATDAARELIDRTILRPAVEAIDAQFADQPTVDAALRHVLALRYADMGMLEAAEPLQRKALATRRIELGPFHPLTLDSVSSMGTLLHAMGRYVEAESYLREALEGRERALGPEHADTFQSVHNLGVLLLSTGNLEEGLQWMLKGLEGWKRTLGPDHADVISSMSGIGAALNALGRNAEAEVYLREAAAACRRVRGDSHGDTMLAVNNLGMVLLAQGKMDEAEPLLNEAMSGFRRLLGDHHPDTLRLVTNIGTLLQSQGRFDEAEPYFREAIENHRRALGPLHADTLMAVNNLGYLLYLRGSFAEARPFFEEALAGFERALGPDHHSTLMSLNNMGMQLQAERQLVQAQDFYQRAVDGYRRTLGADHPETLMAINNVGSVLQHQGRLEQALPYSVEAMEGFARVLGSEHPETLVASSNLGFLLMAMGRLEEAEPHLRASMEGFSKVLGDGHPNTLASKVLLGKVHCEQRRFGDAERLLAFIEPAARDAFIEGNRPRLAVLLTTLGRSRTGLGIGSGTFPAAEANLLEAYAILLETRGATHNDTAECVNACVELYGAWDAAEPGKGYDAKAAEWRARVGSEEKREGGG